MQRGRIVHQTTPAASPFKTDGSQQGLMDASIVGNCGEIAHLEQNSIISGPEREKLASKTLRQILKM
jgi:hypothetical protein